MNNFGWMYLSVLMCTFTAMHCQAAAICPNNDEEARTQFEEAKILRATMQTANAAAERDNKRNRAAQDRALMAIRNPAPAVPQTDAGVTHGYHISSERIGAYAYVGLMAAGLLALLGFIYSMTIRATAARDRENGRMPVAPTRIPRGTRPPFVPSAVLKPADREQFISDMDQLINKFKHSQ